jgi:tight adherence protein C
MARRVGLDDLNSLATLLIQADIFGISVAQTLRVYSDALRTKRQQRAEEKAAKLPVKLLIPLVTCILPALFVAIMGPAGIRMVDVLSKMR